MEVSGQLRAPAALTPKHEAGTHWISYEKLNQNISEKFRILDFENSVLFTRVLLCDK